ncbi:MAG: AsnC family transcriptional regulator [Rhodoferax sp.]|nr:AsnC family transcriptional regulator [Rhodoferax sp.]
MAVSSTKLPVRKTKIRPRSAAPAPAPEAVIEGLDRTDRAILRALQRDASVSNVALAAKVNLSPPACLRRVERLKETGMIQGIVALLNPRALDAGMLVVIAVVLDRSTPESFADFEKAAQKVSGCMECHVVTGEFDYFMLLRTKDSESFNRLHAEQLLYLPAVRQIRSFMVLKQVLSTTQFPI